MKVKTNTPEILVIGSTPWILGAALILFTLFFAAIAMGLILSGKLMGLAFLLGVVLGLAAFSVFVRRTQVVFHRPEGWVEIRTKTVLTIACDISAVRNIAGDCRKLAF